MSNLDNDIQAVINKYSDLLKKYPDDLYGVISAGAKKRMIEEVSALLDDRVSRVNDICRDTINMVQQGSNGAFKSNTAKLLALIGIDDILEAILAEIVAVIRVVLDFLNNLEDINISFPAGVSEELGKMVNEKCNSGTK